MKRFAKIGGIGLPLMVVASCIFSTRAVAQDPVTVPIVVAETAAPIIINAVKPKHKTTGLDKFEGFVMNANSAQITVRAKGNDLTIRTFPLTQAASEKRQKINAKGGYQYGDNDTIYYETAPSSETTMKGKTFTP